MTKRVQKKELNKLFDFSSILFSILISIIIIAFAIKHVLQPSIDSTLVILLCALGFLLIMKLSETETLILTETSIISKKNILYFITMNTNEIHLMDIKNVDYEIYYTSGLIFLRSILPGAQFIKPNNVIINLNNGEQQIYDVEILKSNIVQFVNQANSLIIEM